MKGKLLKILGGLIIVVSFTYLIGKYNARNATNGLLELYILNYSFTVKTHIAYLIYFTLFSILVFFFSSLLKMGIKSTKLHERAINVKQYPYNYISEGFTRILVVINFIIISIIYYFSITWLINASINGETDIYFLLGMNDVLFDKNNSTFQIPLLHMILIAIATIPIICYSIFVIIITVLLWIRAGFRN